MRQWFLKKETQLSIGLFVWFSLWVNAEYLRSLNNLFESLKHGLLKKKLRQPNITILPL